MPVSAMLLAAGRGERMRPLTDTTPKPLLKVRGKPLMQWPMEALAQGGFTDMVVNTAWLGEQIETYFGSVFAFKAPSALRRQLLNQEQSGCPSASTLQIHYSREGRDFGAALETAGGIARALPLLCRAGASEPQAEVFWALAGDVFAPDFVFDQKIVEHFAASGKLAHLWLVPNPEHHPHGDFGLAQGSTDSHGVGLALDLPGGDAQPRYTYSTIGLYRKALFAPPWCDIAAGNPLGVKAALAPLLRLAMRQQRVSAELYRGRWTDVGTVQRLQAINAPDGGGLNE
jgi:MurNAc alpha-1-phosphate uridylyltransferase